MLCKNALSAEKSLIIISKNKNTDLIFRHAREYKECLMSTKFDSKMESNTISPSAVRPPVANLNVVLTLYSLGVVLQQTLVQLFTGVHHGRLKVNSH